MEKSVGLVVFVQVPRGREFLLLHYAGGHWSFPKGHVEPGEDEKQTALRELLEETGITSSQVSILDGLRETISYFFTRQGKRVSKSVVFYAAKAQERPEVKLSFEHVGFEWLPYAEASMRLTYDTDRRVLEKAHDFLVR